jgi:hypothetical protein
MFQFLKLDLEAVDGVVRDFPVEQVCLVRGVGIVADPAGKTAFAVSNHVEVVKVPMFLSEAGVGLGELDLDQGRCMAGKAQPIGFRVVGDIPCAWERQVRERRIAGVVGVAHGALIFDDRGVGSPFPFQLSGNVPMALKTVCTDCRCFKADRSH